MNKENKIIKSKNVLCVLYEKENTLSEELQYLVAHFCGEVVHDFDLKGDLRLERRIYVCGNIEKINTEEEQLFIIKAFSFNYEHCENCKFVELGEVPILIENAGVYFRRLFKEENYFSHIKKEHEFQHLTESNKPGKALRKGIYLTAIEKEETTKEKEILHFRLLRCSSNLSGPTDNFRKSDKEIVSKINEAAHFVFEKPAHLNHVLAQIYLNKKVDSIKN